MDLSSYAGLQAAALEFMARTGVTADTAAVTGWVTLAEARLNRLLDPVETDAALTGTLDSRSISISALSIAQPIALFLAEVGSDEIPVQMQADGTFPYLTSSGRPSKWAIDGTNIDFDRPLDAAYPFRFRYAQRFALATTDPNWLLTNNPDIYLAATLMWGAGYHESWQDGQIWKALLDEGIPEVRHAIAQNKRGMSRIDPALSRIGYRLGIPLTDLTNGNF